ERYGDRFITFFKINEQGEPDKLASYEFDGNHYISKEEFLTENELNDMFAQLAADIGEVNYDFTAFIQDKSETQEGNGALSLGEMTEIKEENYSKIEAYLINPSPVDQIFNKYHSYEGARMMWENGIDKST